MWNWYSTAKPISFFMDPFYIELGGRLRMERLRKRYSLQYVADRIGVTSKTILNYEYGNTKIDIPTVYRICGILEIDSKKLINETIDTIIDTPHSESNRTKRK